MIIEPARFLFMSCKESRKRTSQQRQMSDKFNHKSETIPVTIRGGGCLHGNLWYSPPASMTSRLASVTFKMASKVLIEETDKNLDFTTEILLQFLRFGDFKVSIVLEN